MSERMGPLRAHAHAILEASHARIEADIVQALGNHWVGAPAWLRRYIIPRLGFTVIYQMPAHGMAPEYRGIQRHGKWVIDHGNPCHRSAK